MLLGRELDRFAHAFGAVDLLARPDAGSDDAAGGSAAPKSGTTAAEGAKAGA